MTESLHDAIARQRHIEADIEARRAGFAEASDHFNGVQGRYYAVGAEIARLEAVKETVAGERTAVASAEREFARLGREVFRSLDERLTAIMRAVGDATRESGLRPMTFGYAAREERELGQTRAGFLRESQFVYSQHCKAARDAGIIPNIKSLQTAFRAKGLPVVFVVARHPETFHVPAYGPFWPAARDMGVNLAGSPDTEIIDELAPLTRPDHRARRLLRAIALHQQPRHRPAAEQQTRQKGQQQFQGILPLRGLCAHALDFLILPARRR